MPDSLSWQATDFSEYQLTPLSPHVGRRAVYSAPIEPPFAAVSVGARPRPAQQNRGCSGVVAQLVAGDGHQHGAEAEFERILVARAVGARAGVAAPRHAGVVADNAEVFGEGHERGGCGLFADSVGVGFERRVGLLRQVVEVVHFEKSDFSHVGRA